MSTYPTQSEFAALKARTGIAKIRADEVKDLADKLQVDVDAFAERMKQPAPEPEKDRAREIAEKVVHRTGADNRNTAFLQTFGCPVAKAVNLLASEIRAHGGACAAEARRKMLLDCVLAIDAFRQKALGDADYERASYFRDAMQSLRALLPGAGKDGAK